MFSTEFTSGDFQFLLSGAALTLLVTFWALLGGTILGVAFGVIRSLCPTWVYWPLGAVLDVFRSVPLLIQLILFNALQSILGLGVSNFTISCIVLALYTSAYCSEIVHGGITSVPAPLRRAGRSLGMTWWQDMRLIVFPLSLRVMFPTWIGLALSTLKDTSLVAWLGVIELLKASQVVIIRIQEPLFILMIGGLIYFVISFPLARLGGMLEKRWLEND